tara:strand:- start:328 stop:570 length:243 start_codon:yes stop_codon:yes gene_type:complete
MNIDEFIQQGQVHIDSSKWITNEMNRIVDQIDNLDIDTLPQEQLDDYIAKCEHLLDRATWEDRQVTEFIENNKRKHESDD